MLEIKNLRVSSGGKEILRGLDLTLYKGKIHALMGPNGSGKSTLAFALAGHPRYQITSGQILLEGEDLIPLPPDERAKRGLFLGFQYPVEIKGVMLSHFLWMAQRSLKGDKAGNPIDFRKRVEECLNLLGLDASFADRAINDGFSGGEKKRAEVVQMLVLEPKVAILDETDSGLDIDSVKVAAKGVEHFASQEKTVLLITHYQRILRYVRPDYVHVVLNGRIVLSGDYSLSEELEARGYQWLINQYKEKEGNNDGTK
ncbi:MAG: Fe-S cluster assembly ATPase SufC [bacterium JZ-2024 1]